MQCGEPALMTNLNVGATVQMNYLKITRPALATVIIMLLLPTIFLAACATPQLNQAAQTNSASILPTLTALRPLPQDEEAIQRRIEDGFNQLLHTESFRAYVEQDVSPALAYPIVYNQITLTVPFTVEGTLEFDTTTRIMNDMYIHFASQELEGFFINTVVSTNNDGLRKRSREFWYNFGAGWQDKIEYVDAMHGLAGIMLTVGSPFDFIELPRGFRFRTKTIGYEYLNGRLSEHYAVRGEIVNQDGSVDSMGIESIHFQHIWLDAQSGLPIRLFSESNNMAITYEQIDRLEIKPPCARPCEEK